MTTLYYDDFGKAKVNARYKVTFHDCCVQGEFTAVLASKNYDPDDPGSEPYLESLTFGNGVTLSGTGYDLEEVQGSGGGGN